MMLPGNDAKHGQHLSIVNHRCYTVRGNHFCTKLVQFYRILVFNTLQFCTKPVQFLRLMSENKRNLTEKEEYYKLITDEKSNHIETNANGAGSQCVRRKI